MWQGGEGQRGPGAEIDGPLCPPLRPRPGALCAGAEETCWVLFPFLGAQGERRGVRGPLIRAGRAGQPECRGIIATCSAISLGCRGRGRPRPPRPAGPAAGSPPARPVPGRPVPPPRSSPGRCRPRRRGRASAVRVPPSSAAGAEAAPGEGRTPAEPRLARPRRQQRPEAPGTLPRRPAGLPGRGAGAPKDVCSGAVSEPPGQTQPGGSVCLPPRPAMPTVSFPCPPHACLSTGPPPRAEDQVL